jgi:6-phosphogluconolactonase/glucosamine-6-phosphate isomerase/deaminase
VLPDGTRVPVAAGMPGVAAAVDARPAKGWRLTLCPGYLRGARWVVFLVAGADKAAAMARVLAADPTTPGAWIRGAVTRYVVTRDAVGKEWPRYGAAEIRHA